MIDGSDSVCVRACVTVMSEYKVKQVISVWSDEWSERCHRKIKVEMTTGHRFDAIFKRDRTF